ncbi:MAG: ubiquinol-cytochrome C chaperone [Micavibrio sp.]|nr:ubiquinol-cytochrome C chaperone [Micavibrio sp.]|tara:strand:+ start:654 stop:1208 length:555 start_codon:yes stop_codon:yes gene_type:complete
MLGMFHYRALRKKVAKKLYEVAVNKAREPVFYQDYNVPDTVDGRYEMISLHTFLFIRRLNALGRSKEAQSLFDVMFVIMDKSIREIGVGDLSVPKHMKRMMRGFKGRGFNYADALDTGDMGALKEAVIRNVFGTVKEPEPLDIEAVADYIMSADKALSNVAFEDLVNFEFPVIGNKVQEEQKRV